MKQEKIYGAIATLVGATIGAGILGIPYVISKSGYIIGIIDMLLVFGSMMLINLYLGEVALRTKKKHQLLGYIEKYLGKKWKTISSVVLIFGMYGALIAYTFGEGSALASILGGNQEIYSLIFYAIGCAIIFLGINIFAKFELIVSIFVIISVLAISALLFGQIDIQNFNGIEISTMFVPFGVLLFAFIGAPAIPQMEEELGKNKKELKKAIIIGTTIPLIVYFLFVTISIGTIGDKFQTLPEDQRMANIALESTSKIAGILANLFAIFAMLTSFLAVGVALKQTYEYDLKIKKFLAWIATISLPLIIFLIDSYFIELTSFIKILGIVGALMAGITGIAIVIMHKNAQKVGDREPEYKIKTNNVMTIIIIGFFIIGMAYEIMHTTGIIN